MNEVRKHLQDLAKGKKIKAPRKPAASLYAGQACADKSILGNDFVDEIWGDISSRPLNKAQQASEDGNSSDSEDEGGSNDGNSAAIGDTPGDQIVDCEEGAEDQGVCVFRRMLGSHGVRK